MAIEPLLTFGHKHYVPLLKGKDGEFKALLNVPSAATAAVTPLIEMMPAGRVPLLNRIRLTVSKIQKSWGARGPVFLDLEHVAREESVAVAGSPIHTAIHCFALARAANLQAVPVVTTARSASFLTAARTIAATDNRGAGIRLVAADIRDAASLPARLSTLTAGIGLQPSAIDLILDLRSADGAAVDRVAAIYREAIRRVPSVNDWRTLTIASAAFPSSLAAPMGRGWNRRARADWLGWRDLVTASTPPARLPAYGDYAISHPGLPAAGRAVTLAQLRYTSDTEFLIWKGHDVQEHIEGYGQFHAICADMVTQPEYRTAAFSWGDSQIQAKATTTGDPGGSPTWRAIGTSHHIATVLDQIANLP